MCQLLFAYIHKIAISNAIPNAISNAIPVVMPLYIYNN